jgi:DNA-directed RNA polymerase subunit RPC12/RpoP
MISKRKAGRPGGFVGTSNRTIDYRCAACGREFDREGLRVKRVQFTAMGVPAKLIRSRVIKWLCDDCMHKDDDFIRAPLSDSPGFQDTGLASQA